MFIEIGDNYYNAFEVKRFYYSKKHKKIVVESKNGFKDFVDVPSGWADKPQRYLKRIASGIHMTTGLVNNI